MKHIKRAFAKIISGFIREPKTKKSVYQFIAEYSIFDILQIKKFINTPIKPNSVLLVETNACHGEVISAYFKYFKDMGFNVDLIMHDVIYNENHFTRHDISDINIFHSHTSAMHKMFRCQKMQQYKNIVIMTPVNYTFDIQSVFEMFPELKEFQNTYLIAHNLRDIKNYYQSFNQNHILGCTRHLGQYPNMNPILFGKLHKNNKKHHPTTFISVGGINAKRKNHKQLISIIKDLDDKKLDFKVIIVGGGDKIKIESPQIAKHLVLTGRQIGEKMFQYMEQSDFFLTLWDKNNPVHNKYKTDQASGSIQLILGFNKIPILQKEFADFYDCTDKNAIIYTDNNLASAMEFAIQMNDAQYTKIYNGLDKLSQDVYTESKNNLKHILEQ